LNIAKILVELTSERDRINQAIALLAKIKAIKQKRTVIRARRGRMTPAGRKRLSEAMKKRWAEKRKKRSLLLRPPESSSQAILSGSRRS
jgi:hypothetical protein